MLKDKLVKFLNDNDFDYLLVNSTNEFLVEYNDLQSNSRYRLTGFCGSAGDALVCKNGEVLLFVDGRYHKQAENQVHEGIKVVKLALGETFLSVFVSKLAKNTQIALVSGKISLNFYRNLMKYLPDKKIRPIELNFDPVEDLIDKNVAKKADIISVEASISGKSTENKIAVIQRKLKDNELLLVTNLEEIAYMTNKRAFMQNFSSSFKAKMIIEKNSSKVFYENDLAAFYDKLKSTSRTIYFSPKCLNLKDYNLIKKKSKELKINWVENMKSVKNSSEIKHFKTCFDCSDKVLAAVANYVNSAVELSEQELSSFVKDEFFKNGAKSLSFNTILASGKNSALAHYSTDMNTTTRIAPNSLILLDCGAYFEGGYSTDITRVFCFGKPNNKQKQLYTTVLKAFLHAYNISPKETISGYDIDKKARDTINKNKIKGFSFNHATGHGVGISVHEYPPSISMSELAKTPLKAGMVFTIEPGYYNPDFGGVRLENTVYLAKKQGMFVIKSLSKMKFEEKLIDYDMLNKNEQNWLENWQKGEV